MKFLKKIFLASIFTFLLTSSLSLVFAAGTDAAKVATIENEWKLYTLFKLDDSQASYCQYFDKLNKKQIGEMSESECVKNNWVSLYLLDGKTETLTGVGLMNKYFWFLFSIIIKLAVLACILVIIAGWIMISTAWGEDAWEDWKKKLIWWIAALVVIILSWTILHTINPLFFQW